MDRRDAEGNLYNPALFAGVYPRAVDVTRAYLDLCTQFHAPLSFIKGHVFKLLHHTYAYMQTRPRHRHRHIGIKRRGTGA
jgi:hypothetical protein